MYHALCGKGFFEIAFQGQVIGQCKVHHQSDIVPVFRNIGEACQIPSADGIRSDVHAVQGDGAGGRFHQPGDGVGQLDLSVAGYAGYHEDLTLPHGEGDILYDLIPVFVPDGQMFYAQDFFAESGFRLVHGETDFTAHHQIGHGPGICLGYV